MSSDHSRSFALIAAVVILLFFAHVFIGMQKERQQELTQTPVIVVATTTEAVAIDQLPATEESTAEFVITNTYEKPAANGDLMDPYTELSLKWNGEVIKVGEFIGSCTKLKVNGRPDDESPATTDSTELLENEISGMLCWWAGGGDEVGVFKENGIYLLKKGAQEEPYATEPGFRGDFEVLQQL